MTSTSFASWRARLAAAGIHLLLSGLLAMAVATLTLQFWYPGQIGAIAGGRQLFFLILSVDVVTGPLLTLIVFDRRKPRRELVRDLGIIAALQLGALAYGLYTLYLARPVAVVYEPGRFRVVAAVDVRLEELPQARPEYRRLSLSGPLLLGVHSSKTSEERLTSLDLALSGYDMGQRPSLWRPYAELRDQAWANAKPLDSLAARYPERRVELERALKTMGVALPQGRFLPMVARGHWVVVLKPEGDVAGYAPFDGFF